jgi:hypothetical protein
LLIVAIGLKHFSITGAFIWPLTVPHLSVNALNVSGAIVGVCLLPLAVLSFMRIILTLLIKIVKQKSGENAVTYRAGSCLRTFGSTRARKNKGYELR